MAAVIHIVDDDASFRESLGQLLQVSGYEVVLYDSADKMLASPLNATRGCILLDVRMPGLSGPDLHQHLSQSGSPLPVIFLTGYGTIPASVRAIKAGAEDFLSKPISKLDLLTSVARAVARSEVAIAAREQVNEFRARADRLTAREREVFKRVARGQFNKRIAFELGTTERTVKAHRQKVMQKLGARSLVELVTIAERLGAPIARDGALG